MDVKQLEEGLREGRISELEETNQDLRKKLGEAGARGKENRDAICMLSSWSAGSVPGDSTHHGE